MKTEMVIKMLRHLKSWAFVRGVDPQLSKTWLNLVHGSTFNTIKRSTSTYCLCTKDRRLNLSEVLGSARHHPGKHTTAGADAISGSRIPCPFSTLCRNSLTRSGTV